MLLEVCVDSANGIHAAATGGADRIELCSALAIGGLTPPGSLIRAAAAQALPVHLLARPRDGDFVYAAADRALVADDIRTAAEAGLAGVVIGASMPDRQLDASLLADWIGLARSLAAGRGAPLSLTLHRAFDLTPDLPAALETAVGLGFDSVLTSGGQPRAPDATATLAALHRQADGRIVVLAGSGVTPASLPAILATGISDVHASCRAPAAAPCDSPERRFGFVTGASAETDPAIVAELARLVHQRAARMP